MAIRTAQITVGTSVTNLTPTVQDDSRLDYTVTFVNQSSVSVFVGDVTVSVATGLELKAGLALSVDVAGDGPVYAVTASGTARVDVLATGVA